MIKLPLVLLAISSCSVISYGELPLLIKDSIVGKDIEVTKDFYDSQLYSFSKIKIGRSTVAITVLASIENGRYLWVSQDGERIYTVNGKISETFGLKHNIKTLSGLGRSPSFSYKDIGLAQTNQSNYLLELSNPPAIIAQQSTLINKGIDENYFNAMLYEEIFTSGNLAFKGSNYYWVDPLGRVIKSEQAIHPRLPKVTIEFFYK